MRDLTISDVAEGLAAGTFSATELAEDRLAALEAAAPLNAAVTVTADRALAEARDSDLRRARGDVRGSLDGVPIVHKDIFCTEGVRTTAASRMLEGFVPPYESAVTA